MLARYRHAQLLAALTLLLIIRPFLSGLLGTLLLDLLLLVTLVSAIVACSTRRLHVVIGSVLALGVQLASVSQHIPVIEGAAVAMLPLCLLLFGAVIVLVSISVFRDSRVSANTICGGISIYLLIGLEWAFAFALLENVVPGSFAGVDLGTAFNGFERFTGYSFVTLTTLGYGNIHPLSARAEALAFSEAIVGQIYLTVLVARLVALNVVDARSGPRPPA